MRDDMNSGNAVNMALNWEDVLFNQLQEMDWAFRSLLNVATSLAIVIITLPHKISAMEQIYAE